MRRLPFVLALVLVLVTSTAHATSIGINFSAGTWDMAATDQPGVVAGANWNNVGGSSGTNVALNDNLGSGTTMLLSFNSAGEYAGFSGTSTSNTATNTLYQGGIFGSDAISEVSISLTNIPYASYDVYTYASQDTTATNTLSITDGATTFYYASDGNVNLAASILLLTTSTNSGAPTVGPGQYQLFSGLTSSSFILATGGSLNGILSNNVFGLQVVDTTVPVPEPGSMLLLGTGLTGVVVRRWRRRGAR